MNGMELTDEDSTDKGIGISHLPQLQHIHPLLGLAHPIKAFELLVDILVFIFRVCPVFVVVSILTLVYGVVVRVDFILLVEEGKF
jgi:hypothetical protein